MRPATLELPRIVPIRAGGTMAGSDWIGIRMTEASVLKGVVRVPIFGGYGGLAAFLALLVLLAAPASPGTAKAAERGLSRAIDSSAAGTAAAPGTR